MASSIVGQENLVSLRLDSMDYGTSLPAKASSTHPPGKENSKKGVQVFISTHVEEIKAAVSAPFLAPTATPVTSGPEDIMAVEAAITEDSAALESTIQSLSTKTEQHPARLSESPFVIVQQALPGPDQPCEKVQCPLDLADNPESVPDSMLVDNTQVDNTPGAGLSPPSSTTRKSSTGMKLFPSFINPFSRLSTTKQAGVTRPAKPSTPLRNSNSSSSGPKALLSKFSNSMACIKAVFSPKAPTPANVAVGADAGAATEVPSACSIPSTPSSCQRSTKRMKFSLASFKAPFKLSFSRTPSKLGNSSTAGSMQPPPQSDVVNSSSTITTDTPSNQPTTPAPPVAKSLSPRLSNLQSAARGSLHRLISKAKSINKKRKQHPTAAAVVDASNSSMAK